MPACLCRRADLADLTVEILILEFRHELAFPHGIALIDVGLQHNPVDLRAYSDGHLRAARNPYRQPRRVRLPWTAA